MRKYSWKKIVFGILWLLAGIGTIVLLGAAMQKKNNKPCAEIKIEIRGAAKHMFIDEKDVREILSTTGAITGNPIAALNLRAMESTVEKNPWVQNAEMFLDNNQVLEVRIDERQPVARVFTLDGSSFYLDSNSLRLPLSEKLSARVPVFTGFPSDKPVLSGPDSVLLHNVVKLGKYILADSFWMAQVAQVDITPQSNFEMVPVVGDHIVALGNADDIDKKFHRLYTFYQKAWLQNGINTYEKLDVQYDKQVVAIKKGAGKAWIDSARARDAMKGLLDRAKQGLSDSTAATMKPAVTNPKPLIDSSKIIKPVLPAVKSATKETVKTNSVSKTNNKINKKPLTNRKKSQPQKGKQTKPKAVMDKKA